MGNISNDNFLKKAHGYYPDYGIGYFNHTIFVGDSNDSRRMKNIVDNYVDRFMKGDRGCIINLFRTCPTLLYFIHEDRFAGLKRTLFELFQEGEVHHRIPSEKQKEIKLQVYARQQYIFYRSLGLLEDEINDLILEDARLKFHSYFNEKFKNNPSMSFTKISSECVRQARIRARNKDEVTRLLKKVEKSERNTIPNPRTLLQEIVKVYLHLCYARERLKRIGRLLKYKNIRLSPDEDSITKIIKKKWARVDENEVRKLFQIIREKTKDYETPLGFTEKFAELYSKVMAELPKISRAVLDKKTEPA